MDLMLSSLGLCVFLMGIGCTPRDAACVCNCMRLEAMLALWRLVVVGGLL